MSACRSTGGRSFILPGAVAMHRDLRPGSRGPDVGQLEVALAGMGFSPGAVDGRFDRATQGAVAALLRLARIRAVRADGRPARAAAGRAGRGRSRARRRAPGPQHRRADASRGGARATWSRRGSTSRRHATCVHTAQLGRDGGAHAARNGRGRRRDRGVRRLGGARRLDCAGASRPRPTWTSPSSERRSRSPSRRSGSPCSTATPSRSTRLPTSASARRSRSGPPSRPSCAPRPSSPPPIEAADAIRASTPATRGDGPPGGREPGPGRPPRPRRAAARQARGRGGAAAAAAVAAAGRAPSPGPWTRGRSRPSRRRRRTRHAGRARSPTTSSARAGIQVPADEVVFLPDLPVRVDEVRALRGATLSGPVMTVTSSRLIVDSSLGVSDAKLVAGRGQGDRRRAGPRRADAEAGSRRSTGRPGPAGSIPSRFYFSVHPLDARRVPRRRVREAHDRRDQHARRGARRPGQRGLGRRRRQLARPGRAPAAVPSSSAWCPGLAAEGYVEVRPARGERLRRGDLVVVGQQRTPRPAGAGP